ncbi:tail fiber domain-containing protein [Burkholderia sp. MBR-1]|uniref:tail fiber domain-containing protein n=1 Tax=Burkholderia sp. MBR-1 TaxID=2732364 RepID=UPI0015EFAB73|nr:tail fiber domain-containing protein [Burkholderia sp. MBR-1]QMI45640.1 tail fiber domain-containing protein [Burkholderia sp. MBR-1]
MAKLQKVILGTPPKGSDGDPVRVANSKANANVDVLDRQSALVSAPMITASQTLGEEHIGRRVSINIAVGGTIKLRKVSQCEPDSIVWLVNVGVKRVLLAPGDGSGDTVSISGLNPGEAVALDADGASTWRVLMRGRTNSDNEVVNGNCTVNGNEMVGGTLSVAGLAVFTLRPTFAGNTPWDTGNLAQPATLNTNQTFAAAKTFGSTVTLAQASNVSPSLVLNANGYAPSIRSITNTFSTDFVNGAGNAVNFSVFDTGAAYARASFTVGDTGNVDKITVKNFGSNQGGGLVFIPSSSANNPVVFGAFGGGVSGSISVSGSTTAYNTTSDYRLKANYFPISRARESIRRIKFYTGEFVGAPGVLHDYVIAHELQEVIPEAVTGEKDAMGAWHPVYRDGFLPVTQKWVDVVVGYASDGEPEIKKQIITVPTPVEPGDVIDVVQEISPQAVDYSKIVPRLGAAVQEHDVIIESILTRLEKLESL